MDESERLAITGASGWLGRALVHAASQAGLLARGLARGDAGAARVAAAGGEAVVVGELETERLTSALEGCRTVVHLAGVSAERGGATYEAVNIGGVRRLIDAARRAGVARTVFLSGLGVARYGQARRSTNPYFLAKLTAEVELFRSGLEVVVFRPSYVVGPDDELIPALLAEMARGEVEIVGDGEYRLQPVALDDACRAVLQAAVSRDVASHTVLDLVGPEALGYRSFVERVGRLANASPWRVKPIPVSEAERQAASGGYRGLWSDELDVLLCDEVADAAPLEAFLRGALTPLDESIRRALAGSTPRPLGSFRR
jgi:nucleoside-diphosphate-sugar epimerase